MPVDFGSHTNEDFTAAVLPTVSLFIHSLKKHNETGTETPFETFRKILIHELVELETALIKVKGLEVEEYVKPDSLHALSHSASRCQVTINEFIETIARKQSRQYPQGGKTSPLGIKWALCEGNDLQKFGADLAGHVEATNILLNAIQMQREVSEATTGNRRGGNTSLKLLVQDCFTKAMHKLSAISESITTSVSNSADLLRITTQTAQTDCKIFATVLDIQDLLRRTIAPQVLQSQPVYFVDALGIPAPFYLEFIRSSDAFLAVLKSNLKGHEAAVKRIESGDFVISDVATKQDIDLTRPWQMCLRPGQRVDMSMILSAEVTSISTCPSCQHECAGKVDEDMTCPQFGLTFRRLTEVDESDQKETATGSDQSKGIHLGPERASNKRKRDDDLAQELIMYRKVRLRRQDYKILTQDNNDNSSDKIPPNARWTKINRRLVNPEAASRAGYACVREDEECIVVNQVIVREAIVELAELTKQIRQNREKVWLETVSAKKARKEARGSKPNAPGKGSQRAASKVDEGDAVIPPINHQEMAVEEKRSRDRARSVPFS